MLFGNFGIKCGLQLYDMQDIFAYHEQLPDKINNTSLNPAKTMISQGFS